MKKLLLRFSRSNRIKWMIEILVKYWAVNLLIAMSLTYLFYSCRPIELERELRIENDSIYYIKSKSAVVAASIKDVGGGIAHYGHCWSTNQKPNVLDKHTDFGEALKAEKFESYLTGLAPNTNYFIRSYASRGDYFVYGEELSFYTNELSKAQVKTGEVRYIDSTTVNIVSAIFDMGEGVDTILQYGHCWSTSENPTIIDSTTKLGMRLEAGEFSSELNKLLPLKSYYIKAYVISSAGVSYGDQIVAQTSGKKPVLEIVSIDSITPHSFHYQANITSGGSSTIIGRGICLSTTPNPTINDSYYINGNDIGDYKGKVSDLERATTYYVRAYAENLSGVYYSNEVDTKTFPELAIVQTKEAVDITSNSAVCGGIVVDDGGEELLEFGLCWTTKGDPDTSDNKLIESIYDFSSNLIALEQLTNYEIRAYAINSAGINYGESITFTTLYPYDSLWDYRDNQTYNIIQIGTQVWMAENLKYYVENNTFILHGDSARFYDVYGRLYHVSIANTVCPAGWHLPSKSEFKELESFLGNTNFGNKIKSKTECENDIDCGISNFNLLIGGGYQSEYDQFYSQDYITVFHTSDFGNELVVYKNQSDVEYGYPGSDNGCYYVRCIKNE